MNSITCKAAIALALLSFAGCGAATQNIPISSSPSGATVYADGAEVCTTPCNVPLVTTQAHILTLQKKGYNQADVQISQKYDTAAVTRGAIQSGTEVSSQGASTEGAISNALLAAGTMEEQGTAYVLSPSSVVVDLVPEGQVKHVAQTGDAQAPIEISSDQLAPEDQKALLKTTKTATLGNALEENPEAAAEAALEAGAAAAVPTISTGKTHTSSHSSESFGNDGSYTKKTSSTSVSGSVSVNPVEAGLGVLHLLEDAEGEKSSTEPAQE